MKTIPLLLALAACAQLPAITADVVKDVQCVEVEIGKGNDTFEGIALACAPLAVEQVVTIAGALATGTTASPTLAAKAGKVHHLAPGEQPKPALP
jgi:hypothetical protein